MHKSLLLLLLAALVIVTLAGFARADDPSASEGHSEGDGDTASCATRLETCLITCVSDIFTPEDVATCRQGCASGNDGCLQGHKIAGRFARMRSANARAVAAAAATAEA